MSDENYRDQSSPITITTRFTDIVVNWTEHLQYTAWQITRNREAAEDIVQEAFLALWQQRAKVIPGNPVGWLIKVVANLSARYVKRKQIEIRIYNTLSHEKKNAYSEVEEHLIVKEKYALLKTVIDQLPFQQKIVLRLSKDKGLGRMEIAEYLQLSPNTVKVHLLRARQFMKEHLTFFTIISLLFVCNNIFFSSSNTSRPPDELYPVGNPTDKYMPGKTQTEELLNYKNLMNELAQALTISLKKQ